MGRVIKTVSADGTSAFGAGLSTAQVNALIEAKSKWEFIKKIVITTPVNSLQLSDGIDSTKYNSYLYEFLKIRIFERTKIVVEGQKSLLIIFRL